MTRTVGGATGAVAGHGVVRSSVGPVGLSSGHESSAFATMS